MHTTRAVSEHLVSFVPRLGLTDLENADSARGCGFRSSQQKRVSVLDSNKVLIPKLDVDGGPFLLVSHQAEQAMWVGDLGESLDSP